MLLLSFIVFLSGAVSASAVEPFEAFLNKHCVRCHGPQKEEGDIRIDRLSRDFKSGVDTHHWAEALDKLNSGEMPPEDELQPTQDEITNFVSELDSLLKEGRAVRMAARPAVSHYRLSRKEYQNTVYDLLGVRYDPAKPGELNEDTLWHGYERIGAQLSLSPSHVDRYYRAADIVLDRAFPATCISLWWPPMSWTDVAALPSAMRWPAGAATFSRTAARHYCLIPMLRRCLMGTETASSRR
jgi:hypothetical protein